MRWFVALCFLSLVTVGCIEMNGPEVVVTAEPLPEELQGARWQDLPVRYCVVDSAGGFESTEKFRELTAQAFAAWGVRAVDAGICGGGITRANGTNEVGWGRPPEAQGGGTVDEAGYTRTIFRQCFEGCDGAANEIIEADIIIAGDPPDRWQNSRCLFSTLLHEVGHFLGVPHLDSPAIMAPASSSCVTELTSIDRAAFNRLYGAE